MKSRIDSRRDEVCFVLDTKVHLLENIRYAGYALSGKAYVSMEKSGKGRVKLTFTVKEPGGTSPRPARGAAPRRSRARLERLAQDFTEELEMERIRSKIASNNSRLREYIFGRALGREEAAEIPEEEVGLTEEQQKELDRLIAEVEQEIGKESETKGKSEDPLQVTATWEERYGKNRAE